MRTQLENVSATAVAGGVRANASASGVDGAPDFDFVSGVEDAVNHCEAAVAECTMTQLEGNGLAWGNRHADDCETNACAGCSRVSVTHCGRTTTF